MAMKADKSPTSAYAWFTFNSELPPASQRLGHREQARKFAATSSGKPRRIARLIGMARKGRSDVKATSASAVAPSQRAERSEKGVFGEAREN